jgi:hypothetical protein
MYDLRNDVLLGIAGVDPPRAQVRGASKVSRHVRKRTRGHVWCVLACGDRSMGKVCRSKKSGEYWQ